MNPQTLKKSAMAGCMACAVFLMGNAHASLMNMGSYVYDTNTGLDWLKLTDDRVYDKKAGDVSAQFAAGGALEGWGFASWNQLTSMIGDYYCGGASCTDYGQWIDMDPLEVGHFMALFGNVSDKYAQTQGYATYTDLHKDIPSVSAIWQSDWYAEWTQGFVLSGTNDLMNAWMDNDYFGDAAGKLYEISSVRLVDNADSADNTSSYLVRLHQDSGGGDTGSVPEPGTLALVGAGLCIGLLSRRRKCLPGGEMATYA